MAKKTAARKRPKAGKTAAKVGKAKKRVVRPAKAAKPARKPIRKPVRRPVARPSIVAETRTALAEAANTTEGKKALAGHDEDYQFDLDDGTAFYVSISGGNAAVYDGRTSKTGYFETTYVETDETTLRQLYSGKLRPVDAIEQNRFRMVIRMYEGCQITILMRIAGELSLARFLASHLK